MKVNVKQKRVSKSDTDDGDSVRNTQQQGPGVRTEIEEAVKRNDEVARVPATHREGECRQKSLDVGQVPAVSDELEQHPEGQQCADAVADDLENFEGIKWGHRSKNIFTQRRKEDAKKNSKPLCGSLRLCVNFFTALVCRGPADWRRERDLDPAILSLTRNRRVWRERV